MIEILFTANNKIHASVDLNFEFQQKELLLVPVNTLRNYTYVPPRRLWRTLSVPSHHQTLCLREEREELSMYILQYLIYKTGKDLSIETTTVTQ